MREEVVLITGGSSGIGLAAARRFASSGAHVWLSARDPERLEAAAASVKGTVCVFPADVTEPASLDALLSAIRTRAGRLDVLLNSAGQLGLAPAESSVADLTEHLMRVNYFGMARLVAGALPLLRSGSRKSIVNLSSFVGRIVPPNWSAYAASKHAVQAYSHALRQELRPEGFHVGLILPGPVASPMTEDVLHTPMYPVPFGVPVLQPDDVARAIVRCVARRRPEVTVPGRFGPLLRLGSAFPKLVDLFYLPYARTQRAG